MRPLGLRVGMPVAALAVIATGAAGLHQGRARFSHAEHARLFVTCTTCHAGSEQAGLPLQPPAGACTACHDGTVERRVDWQPRPGPRESNLRFDHPRHIAAERARGDTAATCSACHAEARAAWMQVRGPLAAQCVNCHLPGAPGHLAVPDTACTTCHLPLARATLLSAARVARFPAPDDHRAAGFLAAGGHGAQARRGAGTARVNQACATCHARDFCLACHVDAPEVVAIQALDADARSLVHRPVLRAPATHGMADFERRHGTEAGRRGTPCVTCHTQESCATCHRAAAPAPALALHRAGPDRGVGARTVRRPPASHVPGWDTRHGAVASATTRGCASCHTRDSCLDCHRPDPARRGSYHPPSYLVRHPADAWSRSASCSDCHNQGEFCQSCHRQSGLTATPQLLGRGSYHDGDRQFPIGHGQAARQSLETCVSCHVERDCLTCHSAAGGRGYSPHGPGFNPEKLLRKNPLLCIACHGRTIPGR